jgi:hypothetical protein
MPSSRSPSLPDHFQVAATTCPPHGPIVPPENSGPGRGVNVDPSRVPSTSIHNFSQSIYEQDRSLAQRGCPVQFGQYQDNYSQPSLNVPTFRPPPAHSHSSSGRPSQFNASSYPALKEEDPDTSAPTRLEVSYPLKVPDFF